ncbi:biliverdin-producing heme oxygenase [Brevundimonas sp. Root1423]|uniref:biliverdin-producing heme oxygenase n=1 Tax=Brevundimonas sp. Root1423 TaxID=1736462 RepID=UPI000B1FE22C|nr:biliverdin-producing heme oxygenase [Brevundimonas sp. Root1423]
MSVPPILAAVRAATAPLHDAVEAEAGLEARLRDPLLRPVVVADLLAFHRAAEAAVSPWADAVAAEGLTPAPQTRALQAALSDMRADAPDPVTRAPAPTLGEALGWLYVVEGSMLGGRVMQKAMIRDGIDQQGLGFLDPWGDETGSRWRALISAMESACASGRAAGADIVKGGVDAFSLAHKLLTPVRTTA